MTLLEAVFHREMLLAIGLFALISVSVEILGYRLLRSVSEVAASGWLMEHAVIPAARALSLVVFILIAYPVLFGFETAPAIAELLSGDRLRLANLVNVIFLLSLLLPLLPIVSRIPALVLPIQGIAASSIVFQWWAASQPQVEVGYWPGWMTFIGIIVLALLTHELAKWLSHQLEKRLDTLLHRIGSGKLIYRSVVMIMQVPVILLYTLSLGRYINP